MILKIALHSFSFIIIMLLLNACPHTLVEQIDKSFPKKGTKYKPSYSTMPVSLEKLAKDIKDTSVYKIDSSVASRYGLENEIKFGIGPVGVKVNFGKNDTSNIPDLPEVAKAVQSLPYGVNFHIKKIESNLYPNEIKIQAMAIDGRGRFISGLAAPYLKNPADYKNYWLKIVDSCKGVAYSPDSFEVREVRESSSNPISTVYVLDHSGSMGDMTTRKLQEAAKQMIANTKEIDEVSYIKFDSKNELSLPLTSRTKFVKDSLKVNGLEGFGGGTAIYDALSLALEILDSAKEGNKKVIVLFTDGMDGLSKTSLDSVITLAKKKKVEIYTIAYGLGFSNTSAIEKIARQTKAKFYRIYFDKEFPFVFAEIYLMLNNYYEITYKPKPCESVHIVSAHLNIKEINIENAVAYSYYDKSMLNEDNNEVKFLNIVFASGSAIIDKESYPLLDEVASSLNRYPDMKIEIIGHTDDVGKEEDNLKLSIKRADAVKEYMKTKGIAEDRIISSGKGESEPIVPNDNDEQRKQNRRIEFRVVQQ